MPHGWIDCIHRGQATTKLFPWFALVHATLGVAELVPTGIRVVADACEALGQAVIVLKRRLDHHGRIVKDEGLTVSRSVQRWRMVSNSVGGMSERGKQANRVTSGKTCLYIEVKTITKQVSVGERSPNAQRCHSSVKFCQELVKRFLPLIVSATRRAVPGT